MRPLPLIAFSSSTIGVTKVKVQDVGAGIEGLIAIIQIGGDGEVSADISIGLAGVLDGDNLVDVVL